MDIYKDKEKNMSTLLQLKSVGLQYYILTIQAGYNVFYSETSGEPYTLFGTIADKTVTQMEVTGLTSETSNYYFVVQMMMEMDLIT